MSLTNLEAEYSSFRDPDGFIVLSHGRIFRAVSENAHSFLKKLKNDGLLSRLEETGALVPTSFLVPDNELTQLKQAFPKYPHFVEHKKVPFITYPYEWTYSMLCDSALLHLTLHEELLKNGLSLKDSSAFNVQFIHSQPIFIDTLSIEPLSNPLWSGYGQFCKMFLYPILLFNVNHINNKMCFLPNVEGLSIEEVYESLGFFRSLMPGAFWHVFVQYWLQRNDGQGAIKIKKPPAQPAQGNISPHMHLFLIGRLKKAIQKLRKKAPVRHSRWLDYTNNNSYDDGSKSKKIKFVENFLKTSSLNSVLDLGCNTGMYSEMAAKYVPHVVAIDGDHNCVDELYNRVKKSQLNIQPIWMDIANPSPQLGFHCKERRDFFSRMKSDGVMALALIHHLLIAGGARVSLIRDCLFSLTNKFLLIEYVHPSDPQFESLVGLRNRDFSFFTEEFFKEFFTQASDLVSSEKISPTRTMYLFKKKT